MGSGELIQTLMRHDLIDEYLLFIHPVVLGCGRRMFTDGSPPISLRLIDTTTTTGGVVIATYQPTTNSRRDTTPAALGARRYLRWRWSTTTDRGFVAVLRRARRRRVG
jgi:hypothetical protein